MNFFVQEVAFQKKHSVPEIRWIQAQAQARTKLALETLRLCDLVDADQGGVSDVVQDGIENGRLREAIVVR